MMDLEYYRVRNIYLVICTSQNTKSHYRPADMNAGHSTKEFHVRRVFISKFNAVSIMRFNL